MFIYTQNGTKRVKGVSFRSAAYLVWAHVHRLSLCIKSTVFWFWVKLIISNLSVRENSERMVRGLFTSVHDFATSSSFLSQICLLHFAILLDRCPDLLASLPGWDSVTVRPLLCWGGRIFSFLLSSFLLPRNLGSTLRGILINKPKRLL